jgi:hypothetical protein
MKNINRIVLFFCVFLCFKASAEIECEPAKEKAKSDFAVIYQSYIKTGRESDYRKAWNIIAQYFVKYRGAIGLCLHPAAMSNTIRVLWLKSY